MVKKCIRLRSGALLETSRCCCSPHFSFCMRAAAVRFFILSPPPPLFVRARFRRLLSLASPARSLTRRSAGRLMRAHDTCLFTWRRSGSARLCFAPPRARLILSPPYRANGLCLWPPCAPAGGVGAAAMVRLLQSCSAGQLVLSILLLRFIASHQQRTPSLWPGPSRRFISSLGFIVNSLTLPPTPL